MCTCIFLKANDSYFGRNMDVFNSLNERIIIIPRNYSIKLKRTIDINSHFAMMGIGTIIDDYPLMFEAINEKGLSIAALRFTDNMTYYKENDDKINITSYELILYILAKCENIMQVKLLLKNINITDDNFNKTIKSSPLHFMVSDKNSSIVIETLNDCMHVIDNPYNVLTNNPPFYYHLKNVNNYMHLSNNDPINMMDKRLPLSSYSYGLGALGLPGDYSSASRFIKALFIKNNMEMYNDETLNVIQFFSCLESVKMIQGIVKSNNENEYTLYSSCYNVDKGLLYYKSISNPYINVIDMYELGINLDKIVTYPLISTFKIIKQNKKPLSG